MTNVDTAFGSVYRIGLDGSGYQPIYAFANDDTSGRLPYAPLTQDAAGNLYGTTYSGASEGYGAVYKLSPGGSAFALHKFGNPVDNPDDSGGTSSSSVHLLSVALNPASVTGGKSSTGTVVLDAPAPLQGAVVALSTNNPIAKVFRTVVFSAGQTTATFSVSTRAVGSLTSLSVSAAYNGGSLSASLTIVPPVLVSVSLNPERVTSGSNATGVLRLSGPAPEGGILVNMSSSLPSAVTVPSVVWIRAGASGGSFLAATGQVYSVVTGAVHAVLNDVSKQATLTVWPGTVIPAGIIADATVRGGENANSNYGQQPYLVTETDAANASSSDSVTYLKFDLTRPFVAPTAATLKLTLNGLSTPANGIARVRIFGVADTTWTEMGITWANAPGLNRTSVLGTGTLLSTQDVPLNGGVAAFDVTGYVLSQLGKPVTLQVIADAPDGLCLGVNSREAASGQPALLLTSSFLNDIPAPLWALHVIPTDSSPSSGGPSSSDSVNLASGVEENTPGPDIVGRNPLGPSAVFSRMYRSVQAAQGYGSPGLSPGWTHNYDICVQGVAGAWGALILTYPNGAQERWGPALDGNGAPTGVLHPGELGTPYLVQGVPSPNTAGRWLTLTLTWKDRTYWTFTPDPNMPDFYLLTRITNKVGRSLAIGYDQSHRLTGVTDDATHMHTLLSFQYTAGYLMSVTDPYARRVNFTFGQTNGGYGLTGVSQLSSNALQWQYDYTAINAWPLLSSVGVPDPSAAGGGAILAHPITYYPDGRVATMVDANQNTRLYTYTTTTSVQVFAPNGALVDHWTQAIGPFNNAIGYTDANNATDAVFYGDPNNPYCPTQYTSRNPANQQTISAIYDAYGNARTTQAAFNGGVLTSSYDYDYSTFALGMLVQIDRAGVNGLVQYSYYPNGLVRTVTTPSPGLGFGVGQNAIVPTTSYYYTALGNISMITKPAPNGTGQLVVYRYNYVYDPLGPTQQAEALGQPLTVMAPDGAVTHYRYDGRGNCVAIIDAMGNRVDRVYNIADQLVSTLLPATGQTGPGRAHTDITYQYVGGPAIATKAYGESGNNSPVRHAEQVSGREGEGLAQTGTTEQSSATYDANQRLSALKDANGNAFGHAYDAVGNLSQLTYPSGHSIHAQYDLDGNQTQFTNARGQNTSTILVPSASVPQSVLHSDGHSEQFQYDGSGRLTEVSDGSTKLDYTYDALDNILSVVTQYAEGPAQTTSYNYYPDGSLFYMSQFDGSTIYTYDLCGRLTDVSNINLTSGVYHYDYDLLGRLVHKKTPQTETTYQYNAVGQLTGMTNYDGFQTVISDYSNLHYDGAGNLTQMTVKALPLSTVGPLVSGTVDYSYDSLDHLTREHSQRNLTLPNSMDQVGDFDNASASDAADNLTNLRGVTFSGNSDNQVTRDGNGAAYGYDADGNATTQEGINCQYDDAGHLIAYDGGGGVHLTFRLRPGWSACLEGHQWRAAHLFPLRWRAADDGGRAGWSASALLRLGSGRA